MGEVATKCEQPGSHGNKNECSKFYYANAIDVPAYGEYDQIYALYMVFMRAAL
jgi:hypothetical protein